MISQTAKHALAALTALAEIPNGQYAGAGDLADAIDAPRNYLGKLLKTLADHGLVESQKGKGGGFRLARSPDAISLIDAVEPIDHVSRWSNCFLGRGRCSDDSPCAVHDRWARVRDVYLDFLRETTIADLAARAKIGPSWTSQSVSTLTARRFRMKPTDILSHEHRVIEQVLECLDKMVERSQSEQKLDAQSAGEAVTFFRHFADKCHHAKEEDLLFPAMEAKGFPRDGGPTGVMLYEHEQARDHVRNMDESIEAASQGDSAALKTFGEHARAYASLLRNHIEKEDHCLYTMADQAFTDDDQQELLTAFEKVENEKVGAGVHEQYVSIANGLADRFGVSRAATADAGHGTGCCGH